MKDKVFCHNPIEAYITVITFKYWTYFVCNSFSNYQLEDVYTKDRIMKESIHPSSSDRVNF